MPKTVFDDESYAGINNANSHKLRYRGSTPQKTPVNNDDNYPYSSF